jgi:predicted RND superfamily exporter protein
MFQGDTYKEDPFLVSSSSSSSSSSSLSRSVSSSSLRSSSSFSSSSSVESSEDEWQNEDNDNGDNNNNGRRDKKTRFKLLGGDGKEKGEKNNKNRRLSLSMVSKSVAAVFANATTTTTTTTGSSTDNDDTTKEPPLKGCRSICVCSETNCGDKIENSISRFFYVVGKRVGQYPVMTIIWSMVLCFVCGIGLSMFQSESRPQKLWVPQNTRSDEETAKFGYYFDTNDRIDTLLISLDNDDTNNNNDKSKNVLTKSTLIEAMKLQLSIIQSTSEYDDVDYKLTDLCLEGGGTCRYGYKPKSSLSTKSNNNNNDDEMANWLAPKNSYGSNRQNSNTLNPTMIRTTLRQWSDNQNYIDGDNPYANSKKENQRKKQAQKNNSNNNGNNDRNLKPKDEIMTYSPTPINDDDTPVIFDDDTFADMMGTDTETSMVPTDIPLLMNDDDEIVGSNGGGKGKTKVSVKNDNNKEDDSICDCFVSGILGLWNYDLKLLRDDEDVMRTINEGYDNPEDLEAILGNPVFENITTFSNNKYDDDDDYFVNSNAMTFSPTTYSGTDVPTDANTDSFTTDNDNGETVQKGKLISADALVVSYFLKDRSYVVKGETVDPINEAWEENVFLYNAKVADENVTLSLTVDRFSSRSVADEFGGRLGDDIRFVIVSYFIAFLFVATTIGSKLRCNGPGSRWTLSLAVLGIVALSTIAGLGLSSAFGLVFGPVHSNLPFILLGIGVDDAFVIANAMDRERKVPRNCEDNTEIGMRSARALSNAGSSITVTSATDFIAFAISAVSSIIPSLASFCAFAAISILLLWLFSSTFFAAALVLDERRQRDNRRECYCCFERQPNENCLGIVVDPGNKDESNRNRGISNYRSPISMKASPPAPKSERFEDYYDDDSDDEYKNDHDHLSSNFNEIDARGFQEGKLAKYFRDYHCPIILSKWGKIVSFVVFSSLLLFGIIGASKLTMEDTSREFIPPGSYLIDYWNAADSYFPSKGIDIYITFENVDNVDVAEDDGETTVVVTAATTGINDELYKYRDDISNLSYRLKGLSKASPWIAEPNSDSSYRNVFQGLKEYLKENGTRKIGDAPLDNENWPTTKEFFYYTLRQYVERGKPGAVYSQDVSFDDDGIPIAIRIKSEYVRLVKDDKRDVDGASIDDAERQIDAMVDTRSMIDDWTDLPTNRFVFSSKFFRIEGFQVIKAEMIRNVVLAVIAVALIVFLTLPSPVTAFLITINVAFCLVEILGFMWALGIAIDTVSVINLILAVGLSVDYSAHVGHSFMMKGGYSKPKRVTEALADMGSAVLAGGISTFLAVAVLLFLKSYVFWVLSRQLCLTVVLGLMHGLILLPIMLSLVGPRPFGAATNPIYNVAEKEVSIARINEASATSIIEDRQISSSYRNYNVDADVTLEKLFDDEDTSDESSDRRNNKLKYSSKFTSKSRINKAEEDRSLYAEPMEDDDDDDKDSLSSDSDSDTNSSFDETACEGKYIDENSVSSSSSSSRGRSDESSASNSSTSSLSRERSQSPSQNLTESVGPLGGWFKRSSKGWAKDPSPTILNKEKDCGDDDSSSSENDSGEVFDNVEALQEDWSARSSDDPTWWANEDDADNKEGTSKTKETILCDDASSSSSSSSFSMLEDTTAGPVVSGEHDGRLVV